MKRRDFFKAVTGFVAGVFAAFVPKSKATMKPWPTEIDPKLANIDSNSEWAKSFDDLDIDLPFLKAKYRNGKWTIFDEPKKLNNGWTRRSGTKITFPTERGCYSDGHIYVVEWRTGIISPRTSVLPEGKRID